jgi:GT2 family glycosyltransferase
LEITPTFEANRIERINEPIAIIIPTRNNFDVLSRCVTSILRFSGRHKLNIYIADTGSSEATKQRYEVYANHIKVLEYDYYHFAKINNDVVKNHLNGEKYLLFCNDDVEFLNDAIGNMFREDASIGTVGARLHFPNGMVQHDGVFINTSDNRINVGHRGYKTYHNWEEKNHTVIANTGALLFVSTKNFNRAGRFNENVKECFEDVLLNLELIKLGKKNVLCSNAVAIHHESVTRKKNVMKQENERHDLLTHVYPEIKKNAKIYARYFS